MKSLHTVVIRAQMRGLSRYNYIRYWSAINSFKWNVESTSKLDYKRASISFRSQWSPLGLLVHGVTFVLRILGFSFISVNNDNLIKCKVALDLINCPFGLG